MTWIAQALDRTLVALVLEGPGLVASEFVMGTEVPSFLRARHLGVKVLRVPVYPILPDAIPQGLKACQTVWPLDRPLGLMTKQKRKGAIPAILEETLRVYDRALAQPKHGGLSFEVEPGQPLRVYPDRLYEFSRSSEFEALELRLHPPFVSKLETWAESGQMLEAPWELELPNRGAWRGAFESTSMTPDRLKLDDGLERLCAALYPRYRDAHLALFSCLNGEATLDRESLRHAKLILRSLFRKHDALWDASVDSPRCETFRSNALGQFVRTIEALPVFHLAFLQAVDEAERRDDPVELVRASYKGVDRICHWLLMTHRLLRIPLDQLRSA